MSGVHDRCDGHEPGPCKSGLASERKSGMQAGQRWRRAMVGVLVLGCQSVMPGVVSFAQEPVGADDRARDDVDFGADDGVDDAAKVGDWGDDASGGVAALVVSGLGGNPDYQSAFDQQSEALSNALGSLTPAGAQVRRLDGERATRESVLSALSSLIQAQPERFYLVLIGHGNDDATGYRFNLPGPDLTEADLVGALAAGSDIEQIVIAATSASGALLESLTEPGRLLLTATRSGREINAVRFPGFLADALTSGRADLDRNEILTVEEAFDHALEQTAKSYESEQLIVSEHARLEGEGADRVPLAYVGALRKSIGDPQVNSLLDERLSMETDFDALVARKPHMAITDYYAELEVKLLEMARLQLRIDAATGWSGDDG